MQRDGIQRKKRWEVMGIKASPEPRLSVRMYVLSSARKCFAPPRSTGKRTNRLEVAWRHSSAKIYHIYASVDCVAAPMNRPDSPAPVQGGSTPLSTIRELSCGTSNTSHFYTVFLLGTAQASCLLKLMFLFLHVRRHGPACRDTTEAVQPPLADGSCFNPGYTSLQVCLDPQRTKSNFQAGLFTPWP